MTTIPAYWLFLLFAWLPGGVQPPADMPRDLIVNVRALPMDGYACVGSDSQYCKAGEIAITDRIWSEKGWAAQHIIAHEVGHFLYPNDGEWGAEQYACKTTRLATRTYNMECVNGTLRTVLR